MCSIPLAALLNATYRKNKNRMSIIPIKGRQKGVLKVRGSNLEEILGDDSESLCVIADAFEVGVLIQHRVVGIQEEVKGVLVQEVHLGEDTKNDY